MADHRVGMIGVCESSVHLLGVLSEEDVVRLVTVYGNASLTMSVEPLAARDVWVCSPDDTTQDVMTIMSEQGCRHVPVVERGVLVGIIETADIVRYLAETGGGR